MIDTFLSVAYSVGIVLFVALTAGILSRRRLITSTQTDGLSRLTVFIFLPALILGQNLTRFDPRAIPHWWAIPLGMAVFLIATAYLCRKVLFRWSEKRNLMTVIAVFQNVAYLPLAIGYTLYPDNPDFLTYVFLFQLGLTPVLWSLGKILVTAEGKVKITGKAFLNPPFIANAVSILIVLVGAERWIPSLFTDACNLVGKAAVPSSIVVLGAMLGTIPLKKFPRTAEILSTMGVKFVMIPAIAVAGCYFSGLYLHYPFLCEVIVLQAASAPATNAMIMIRTYGTDKTAEKAGSLMLIGYLLCLLMMPLWLVVWKMTIGAIG